jgi:hypothetical protein
MREGSYEAAPPLSERAVDRLSEHRNTLSVTWQSPAVFRAGTHGFASTERDRDLAAPPGVAKCPQIALGLPLIENVKTALRLIKDCTDTASLPNLARQRQGAEAF